MSISILAKIRSLSQDVGRPPIEDIKRFKVSKFFPNPGYQSQYMAREFTAYIRQNILGRNPKVLDWENVTFCWPHTCLKRPNDICLGCTRQLSVTVHLKIELDEVPVRLMEVVIPPKVYKRKRWQTEHKAFLIQKKWNKRTKGTEVKPARIVEAHAMTRLQAKVFNDHLHIRSQNERR